MTSSPEPSVPPPPWPMQSWPPPSSGPSALWAPPPWPPTDGPVAFADPDVAGRRRRRALRATLVAVPTLLVVAGASSFITLLVAGGGHTTTAGTGTAAAAGGSTAAAKDATVGTLVSEHGSSWDVRTAAGRTVTVDVRSGTAFGSRSQPSSASAFHAGSTVRVVGAMKGSTVDARRVVLVHPAAGGTAG